MACATLQGKESGAERRYKRLLAGLELTRDFFWSYGWPLWRTVQANLGAAAPGRPFDSMFVWNDYLTRCVLHLVSIYNDSSYLVLQS